MPDDACPASRSGLFPSGQIDLAAAVLTAARVRNLRIATVETVTSGLLSACLTSVSGASAIFERGYVLYHSLAKATGLGVPEDWSAKYGAVSAEITRGFALGLLDHSQAWVTVAVTGYAGPGGGNARNPVGTIFVAAASRDGAVNEERHIFSGDRDSIRLSAVGAGLRLLHERLTALDSNIGESVFPSSPPVREISR